MRNKDTVFKYEINDEIQNLATHKFQLIKLYNLSLSDLSFIGRVQRTIKLIDIYDNK